jgi:hypothetical protein
VAAVVEATNGIGIVVERPMYFRYGGTVGIDGGHTALGTATPRTAWLFAEGYTGTGFDEYLTLLNPNPTAANIRITYYLGDDTIQIKTLTAPATARTTVAVHEPTHGVGRGRAVAALVEVTNGLGVIVERPIYFAYSGSMGVVTGGHNSVGAPATRASWFFAEGFTGAGFDEYLTLLAPDGATVAITYYLSHGGTRTRTATVAGRGTVAVHDLAHGVGRDQAVAASVEVISDGSGVVVERPMYFRYLPAWGQGANGLTGGHTSLGYAP